MWNLKKKSPLAAEKLSFLEGSSCCFFSLQNELLQLILRRVFCVWCCILKCQTGLQRMISQDEKSKHIFIWKHYFKTKAKISFCLKRGKLKKTSTLPFLTCLTLGHVKYYLFPTLLSWEKFQGNACFRIWKHVGSCSFGVLSRWMDLFLCPPNF